MAFIEEKLQTKVYGEYDVVVVGSGPAGCGAAITAAREGLKTLIIERFNCLGGMWTTGFMNPFFDCRTKLGLVKELREELDSRSQWGGFQNISFNYEYMKRILEEKAVEAGVEILYNTTFCKTICEDKTVKGVICQNIEGRFAVLAKTVFDCSGDGAVAADAGCPFEIGEDGDWKECQAMTLMFLVGNIPEKYREVGLKLKEKIISIYEKAGKDLPFDNPYLIPVPNSHFGVIQFTHVYEKNPLSAKELTEANIELRRQIIEGFELLREYDEEFKDLDLITSASILGVRESRRIIGDYTITEDDIFSGRKFEDAVARVRFNADLHTKSNKGQHVYKVVPYQVPLRAMLPKGYNGIIVAGRCISGERRPMASYRVTGDCCQMAENAAKALAKATRENIDIRDVKFTFDLIQK